MGLGSGPVILVFERSECLRGGKYYVQGRKWADFLSSCSWFEKLRVSGDWSTGLSIRRLEIYGPVSMLHRRACTKEKEKKKKFFMASFLERGICFRGGQCTLLMTGYAPKAP